MKHFISLHNVILFQFEINFDNNNDNHIYIISKISLVIDKE